MLMMRQVIVAFLIVCGPVTLFGQPEMNPGVDYKMPSNMAVILISNQASCPVSIDSVNLFLNGQANRVTGLYTLRNSGSRPIRNVTIKVLTNFMFRPVGGGNFEVYEDSLVFGESLKSSKGLLNPNSSIVIGRPEIGKSPEMPSTLASWVFRQPSRLRARYVVTFAVTSILFDGGETVSFDSNSDDVIDFLSGGVAR